MKPVHGRMLEDYLATVRRRWVVMLLGLVIVLCAGVGFMLLANKTYVASAKVLVEQTNIDPVAEGSRTTDSINLDTEAQLVKSARVASRVREILDTATSAQELARRVTVMVPPNTTVLEISFSAGTAGEARDGAQAFADVYLQRRDQAAKSAVADNAAAYQSEITSTRSELTKVNKKLQGNASASTRAMLVARRDTLNERISSLSTGLSVLSGVVVRPGVVINEAQSPSRPASPNPMLVLPSSLFLGMLLGLTLAMWRERVDTRVHSVVDLDRVFGLTPLAELEVTVGSGVGAGRYHYDVRALYHSIRANGPDSAEVALVFAPGSSAATEGVSRALGLVAARSGAATTYLTGATDASGAVVRRQSSGGVFRDVHFDDIGLVHDGEVSSERLQAEIKSLRADNGFVVIELPSNDPDVDLPMLARHVDVVLMLVHLGETTRPAVHDALRSLSTSGAKAVFAATVDLRRRGRGARHKPLESEHEVVPVAEVPPAEELEPSDVDGDTGNRWRRQSRARDVTARTG